MGCELRVQVIQRLVTALITLITLIKSRTSKKLIVNTSFVMIRVTKEKVKNLKQ